MKTLILLLLPFSIIFSWEFNWKVPGNEKEEKTFIKRSFDYYQKNISTLQGSRCPMRPSCSFYTKEAINSYGLFIGVIMGIERIFIRERGAVTERKDYFYLKENGKKYIYDPVKVNYIFNDYNRMLLQPEIITDK